jgi:fatty acid desaturase
VGFFRDSRAPQAVSITTATQSRNDEIHGREVRYILMMLVRVVCFVLAATLFHGVLRWIAMGIALILPWLAVVVANQPHTLAAPKVAPVPPKATGALPPARERVLDGEWRSSGVVAPREPGDDRTP